MSVSPAAIATTVVAIALILGVAAGFITFFLLGRTRRCRHDQDFGRDAVGRKAWADSNHQTRIRQSAPFDRPVLHRNP